MRNQTREAFGRALLKLVGPRFRGSWRDDLVDMLKAGPIGAAQLVLASYRLDVPLSDLLLIARLRRRVERMTMERLEKLSTSNEKVRYTDDGFR